MYCLYKSTYFYNKLSVLYSVGEKSTKIIWRQYKKVVLVRPYICRKIQDYAKKITKTIRVSIDVKQHLDEMKGSVSASEFIETMLSYFERNGVDPRTSINGKFKTLELQGIERIIKIIRAIEKDKIDKLLPASEAHSDDLLKQADKQVTQLKAEVERLKKASAPDVVGRNKLGQVVRLLENAFDQKNFKKAEKGTDYFVAPVYLEMLLYKVKEICS
ncbi:hypothetical protein BvMPK_1047 [Phocaeicola vulgatus]|uniref:Mobilization protein n=5 Tax=Bacteroidales TaxID=171549 RepID=A0A0P0LDM7_PHOVU|nr:hypothetical protein BvMPK_1047 [Phocaeicola vulgatus]